MLRLFLTIALLSSPVLGQTVSLTNTANGGLNVPEYGADFVAGDTFEISIEGAAPDSEVTATASLNGAPLNGGDPYSFGYTDGDGNFTTTGTEVTADIGAWLQTWYVGGEALTGGLEDGELVFEVIPVPTSLSVNSVSVLSVASSNWPSGCTSDSYYYGIAVDIFYTIQDINNTNIATTVLMEPYEEGTWYAANNTPDGTYSGDIGPDTQYSDSPDPDADDDGTFHDVPNGTCFYTTFSNAGASQEIGIYIGENFYTVRSSQRMTTNGTGYQHGNTGNGSDISASF